MKSIPYYIYVNETVFNNYACLFSLSNKFYIIHHVVISPFLLTLPLSIPYSSQILMGRCLVSKNLWNNTFLGFPPARDDRKLEPILQISFVSIPIHGPRKHYDL